MRSKVVKQSGFTVIELIVAMGIASIMMGIAVANLREFNDPLLDASQQLMGFVKQVRARAISSTQAYTIVPESSTSLKTYYGVNCESVDTTYDDSLVVELPAGATLYDTTWSLCFNSRGLPDGNLEIDLRDSHGLAKTVEVYLGGGVRVY